MYLRSLLITHTAVRERERERERGRERERKREREREANPILCPCMLDYLAGDLIEHIVYITEMPYTHMHQRPPQHNGNACVHT